MTEVIDEPLWLGLARARIGEREVKGPMHNSRILSWWRRIFRGGIKDDETPWCAAFVGACLEDAGIRSTRFESARSYLDWGVKLDAPIMGCVTVFSRTGGGHVGFCVGISSDGGRLAILGGNQGDAVSIAWLPRNRAVGYRWPAGFQPLPRLLPVLADLMPSASEA